MKSLMFLGIDQTGAATWTWNGLTWTLQSPATSPPQRTAEAMSTWSTLGVVIFSGSSSYNQADTWLWNGVTWAPVVTEAYPSYRYYSGMAYDSATHSVLLFGGATGYPSVALGDTWVLQ